MSTKKEKEPLPPSRAMMIAQICGLLSGASDSIDHAKQKMRDVERRCNDALEHNTKLKVLTTKEIQQINALMLKSTETGELDCFRREIAAMLARAPKWKH